MGFYSWQIPNWTERKIQTQTSQQKDYALISNWKLYVRFEMKTKRIDLLGDNSDGRYLRFRILCRKSEREYPNLRISCHKFGEDIRYFGYYVANLKENIRSFGFHATNSGKTSETSDIMPQNWKEISRLIKYNPTKKGTDENIIKYIEFKIVKPKIIR